MRTDPAAPISWTRTLGTLKSVLQDSSRLSTPTSRVTRNRRKNRQSQLDPQELASQPQDDNLSQGVPESVSQGPSHPLPSTSRVTRNQRKNQQSQLDLQELASQSQHDNLSQGMPESVPQGPSHPLPSTSRVTQNQPENDRSQLDLHEPGSQPKHENLVNAQGMSQPVSRCPTHDPNQYRAVHDFLQASVPPMTHLMDAFIDFGCINAHFLRTISTWPFEKIRCVLDQLSPGSNDKKLTGMEKFILQDHFKDYFA